MTWQVQDVLGIFDESRRHGGPGEKEVNYIQAEELVYRMDLLWKTALGIWVKMNDIYGDWSMESER